MGCVFLTLGAVAYLCAHGIKIVAFAEFLIGVGMAFFSGAEQAWITDALHREGRDCERRHVFAMTSVVKSVAVIVGGFFGSLIALYDVCLIWLPLTILAPVTFHKMSEGEALLASVELLKKSRSLVWVILAMIVSGGIVAFNHFWSPYFKPMVGTLGLSLIWACIYLACVLSGLWIRKLNVPQGDESNLIIFALIITGIGMMLAGVTNGLWIPLSGAMIHEFGRGMFMPLVDSFVQHRVESGFRATFGSLQSLLGRVGLVIAPLLIWFTIRNDPNTQSTIGFIWFACGIVIVVGALILCFARPRNSQT